MNFLELAQKRQSVRNYSDKPVEKAKIIRCIEAARLAPSACNGQPWKFIIIDNAELKNRISNETFGKVISFNHFSMQARVLVAIVSEKTKLSAQLGAIVKKRNFKLMDVGIAAEHFCLQAAEQGLGTCMMGWFNERQIARLLKVPKSKRVELVIAAGYAKSDQIRPKNRKDTDQICSYNAY